MSRFLSYLMRLAVLAASLAPLLALADPPARVGRLSLLEGDVLFRIDRQDAGVPATLNWPISSGAILDTGKDGRAEIGIAASTFRLGGNSRVEFAAIDDEHTSLQMAQGSLAVTVRDRDAATGIAIATPAAQVRFEAPGRYRIDVDAQSGDLQVASRGGTAYIERAGGELAVSDGQRAIARRSGGWFIAANRSDAFDAWSDARDSAGDALTASRYVSPQTTGYEDLDRYGSWSVAPDYGALWYPRDVAADWAPYRYGRWAWVSPWGWTWVDDAPWGFAPFHYGRWALVGGRWAWAPGAFTPRPVYAPALVGWVGDPGWSVGFSAGTAPAVGWFPLAPREVYVPAYRSSPRYIQRMNVAHVTNIAVIERFAGGHQTPAFIHRTQPRAVTVVPAEAMRHGDPVARFNWHPRDRRELGRAPIAAQAPGTAWLPPAAGPQAHRERGAPFKPLERSTPTPSANNFRSEHGVPNPPPRTENTMPLQRHQAPFEHTRPQTAVTPGPDTEPQRLPRHLGSVPQSETPAIVPPQAIQVPATQPLGRQAQPELRQGARPEFRHDASERPLAPTTPEAIQPQRRFGTVPINETPAIVPPQTIQVPPTQPLGRQAQPELRQGTWPASRRNTGERPPVPAAPEPVQPQRHFGSVPVNETGAVTPPQAIQGALPQPPARPPRPEFHPGARPDLIRNQDERPPAPTTTQPEPRPQNHPLFSPQATHPAPREPVPQAMPTPRPDIQPAARPGPGSRDGTHERLHERLKGINSGERGAPPQ